MKKVFITIMLGIFAVLTVAGCSSDDAPKTEKSSGHVSETTKTTIDQNTACHLEGPRIIYRWKKLPPLTTEERKDLSVLHARNAEDRKIVAELHDWADRCRSYFSDNLVWVDEISN